MDFDDYQELSQKTAKYPREGLSWLTYPVLGLNGEAGEVAEKVKKIVRDSGGVLTEEHVEAIAKELGDCLWYISAIASELNLKLSDVAQANVDKLQSRKKRGKISGSGDDR